jgi:hypothetical protein
MDKKLATVLAIATVVLLGIIAISVAVPFAAQVKQKADQQSAINAAKAKAEALGEGSAEKAVRDMAAKKYNRSDVGVLLTAQEFTDEVSRSVATSDTEGQKRLLKMAGIAFSGKTEAQFYFLVYFGKLTPDTACILTMVYKETGDENWKFE